MGPYWLAYEHIFHIIAIIAFSFEGRTLALLLTLSQSIRHCHWHWHWKSTWKRIDIGIAIEKPSKRNIGIDIGIENGTSKKHWHWHWLPNVPLLMSGIDAWVMPSIGNFSNYTLKVTLWAITLQPMWKDDKNINFITEILIHYKIFLGPFFH